MPSYFSFIFQKLFLIIFISLNLFGNCGSSSLHFNNNQRQSSNSYGEFGQYYGNNGRNGNELELAEWNGGGGGGRRRSNARILSEQQQQFNNKKNLNYEIVTSAAFTFEDYCTERCQIPCSPLFVFQERDKDPKLQFNCAKLKPPERKFHEKLVGAISGASVFEFFALAIAICCVCSCYQCLCKSSPQIILRNRQQQINLEEENELNKNIPPNGVLVNGGGISTTTSTGVSPEHDQLISDKIPHIDEGIHPAPLVNLTNNQQQKQQHNYIKPGGHHHYVKTNLFKGNGEQQQHSIV
uniref:CX domain-containing protein n=1 Tax=Meloidogyne floridensis TaxID=298350 RepID=A0A915NNQ2_9BILA